jgi:hypothetical protein
MIELCQQQLSTNLYCHIRNFADLIEFDQHGVKTFKKFWENLKLDQNFKDYTHRERRILRYVYKYQEKLEINYDSEYNSSVDYTVNYKRGVNQLTYAEDEFIVDNILKQLIIADIKIVENLLNKSDSYMITIHLFRVLSTDGKSSPTTSGIHKDGMDLVCMHFINAQNIIPVISTLYKDNVPESQILNLPMSNFLEAIIVDDNRLYHSATEVKQLDLTEPAFRDLLLVTFKRVA